MNSSLPCTNEIQGEMYNLSLNKYIFLQILQHCYQSQFPVIIYLHNYKSHKLKKKYFILIVLIIITFFSVLKIVQRVSSRTRWFSNHRSCLLLRSHTFAIIVILDLTPYLLRAYVRIYPRIIFGQVPWKYITDHFSKTSTKRSISLHDPQMIFDPTYINVLCAILPKDLKIPW